MLFVNLINIILISWKTVYSYVRGYEKRGISSLFVFLCFLVSIESVTPELYDDANDFYICCFLIMLCGKLAAILVYCENENEQRS